MAYLQVTPPAGGFNSEQLFDVVARLGLIESVKTGVFNNLKNASGSSPTSRTIGIKLPVKAPTDTTYAKTFGYGTLDLSSFNLQGTTFTLAGTVVNGATGVSYNVAFKDVTDQKATVHVTSYTTDPSSSTTAPDLNIIVSITVTVA